MQIETYECTEDVINSETEDAEEVARLIDELGLEGQREMGTASGNCYRLMTVEEKAVYMALLPEKTEVSTFKTAPIPLRVLQVAAHAKQFYPYLEVWFDTTQDDPLLVGKPKQYDNNNIAMLARWGDVLKSYAELRIKAGEVILTKMRTAYLRAASQAKSGVESCSAMTPLDALATFGTSSPPWLHHSL